MLLRAAEYANDTVSADYTVLIVVLGVLVLAALITRK